MNLSPITKKQIVDTTKNTTIKAIILLRDILEYIAELNKFTHLQICILFSTLGE